tara:strand:+ start:231 stop:584 length:354 start_codon:yes stop_codon:yes gene_type:complete
MARKIKIDDIAGLMEDEIQEVVERATLLLAARVKDETPFDTGTLRNDWQENIGKFRATVTNSMEYAEPVLYGNNLPPSWQGRYRTRQGTVPGFPDLIAKEIAVKEVPRIVEAFRRRN